MKTSTLVILAFAGLICLAVTILLVPAPKPPAAGPGQQLNPDPEIAEAPGAASSEQSVSAVPDPEIAAATTEPAASPATVPSEPVSDESATAAATPVTESATQEQVQAPLLPLKFPEWPKPALAFVVTGEQLGYFEPCGCTANQLGGMSRRASLFDQVRGLGWEVRGIEVGSLSRRSGIQAQIKFETTLEALRELGYVAMGLGVEELRLEPDYLLSQHLTDGPEPLKFLGANLVFFGARDLGTPLPFAVIDVNGVKVGVTSVMSESVRKKLIPDRSPEDAAVADLNCTDAAAALSEVMQAFDEQQVQFRILISHSQLDESRALAAQFPKLNLILAANGFGDGEINPEVIGSVRMLQVGKKGRAAGVVGVYPGDPADPVRFELVTLDGRRLPDAPRMTELMQRYQDRLREQSIVTASEPSAHPSGALFVGAAKCGECHTTAMKIWQETPHAHAFESLDPSNKRPGHERLHGVVRSFDPECIACHVTGWDPAEYVRFQSGFVNEQFASTDDERKLQSLLAGNQCENCHGPGSRHVELIESGDAAAAANEVRVTLEQARENSCTGCHDLDNSPKFHFDEYWEQVKHSGLD